MSTTRGGLRAFGGDRSGTIAVLFALVSVPLIAVAATAIDYGRALKVQATMQNAVDAATGAARRHLLADDDKILDVLRANLDANLPDDLRGMPFEFRLDDSPKRLTVRLHTQVMTSLMALVGVPVMQIAVESVAMLPKPASPGAAGGGVPVEPADAARINDRVRDAMRGPGRGGPPGPPSPSAADQETERALRELESRVREIMRNNGIETSGGDIEGLRKLLER